MGQAWALRPIVENYCDHFAAQLDGLVGLLQQANASSTVDRRVVDAVRAEAHRMAGAAHCMGFVFVGTEISQVEGQLQEILDLSLQPDPEIVGAVCQKLVSMRGIKRHVTPENSRLLREDFANDPAFTERLYDVETRSILSRQRVLFADDDASVRALMRTILASLGVEAVRIVASGAEALDEVAAFQPTVLISDWHMEPMNGLDLLELIRGGQTSLPREAKVIFLTSEPGIKAVGKVIRRGVDHFLVKPFSQDVIARALAKVAVRAPRPA